MKVQNLDKLYEAVIATGQKAYMQKATQDILNMAAATLQMAQAYQMMKECELHEKFHSQSDGSFRLPGEGPLENHN